MDYTPEEKAKIALEAERQHEREVFELANREFALSVGNRALRRKHKALARATK